MKKGVKIFAGLLIAFVAIQLIPVDRTNPPVNKNENFITIQQTPEKISQLLNKACYDCHSFETKYPNYAYVAPISWSVKHHVNEGREHANFSIWGTYNTYLKKNILEKSVDAIQNRKMPLPGYLVYHKEANLSEAERKILTNYLEEILKSGNY